MNLKPGDVVRCGERLDDTYIFALVKDNHYALICISNGAVILPIPVEATTTTVETLVEDGAALIDNIETTPSVHASRAGNVVKLLF